LFLFLQPNESGQRHRALVTLFELTVLALIAFFALVAVSGIAAVLLGRHRSSERVFDNFADGVARELVGWSFANEGSGDLEATEEDMGLVVLDVPLSVMAEDLVYSHGDAAGVFDGGQQEHAGLLGEFAGRTARPAMEEAKRLSLEGGCLAFVAAGEDVPAFLEHDCSQSPAHMFLGLKIKI